MSARTTTADALRCYADGQRAVLKTIQGRLDDGTVDKLTGREALLLLKAAIHVSLVELEGVRS